MEGLNNKIRNCLRLGLFLVLGVAIYKSVIKIKSDRTTISVTQIAGRAKFPSITMCPMAAGLSKTPKQSFEDFVQFQEETKNLFDGLIAIGQEYKTMYVFNSVYINCS
jgi:hypothetical protein